VGVRALTRAPGAREPSRRVAALAWRLGPSASPPDAAPTGAGSWGHRAFARCRLSFAFPAARCGRRSLL